MAQSDINLTADVALEINNASVRAITKRLEGISNEFTKSLGEAFAMRNQNGLTGGYFSGVSSAYSNYKSSISKLSDNLPAGFNLKTAVSTGIDKKLAKRTLDVLQDLKELEAISRNISRYDGVPLQANKIAEATKSGDVSAFKALGKYGVTQRRLGRLVNSLMWARAIRPDLVPEDVVEAAETNRQTFLQIGNENRAQTRYVQKQQIWESAVERAMRFGIQEVGQGAAQPFLDYFGLDYKADSRLKHIDPRAYKGVEDWTETLAGIKEKEEALKGGDLSVKDTRKTIKELTSLTKKLVTQGNKLGTNIAENSKRIAANTQATIDSFGDGSGTGMGAVWKGFIANSIKDVASFGAFAAESMWGEHITRNVYDSRRAYAERVRKGGETAGKILGGLGGIVAGAKAGAALGGTLGSVAPGAGNVIGAGVGGAIGAAGGLLVGGLYGSYQQKMLESDIKSAGQMASRLRAKSLFGQQYNTFFAQEISDSGIANGETAMSTLADKAMGMRGRMMLGQVGEQEMLYMSMMPNYYAALMSGVTGPELAQIFATDLQNIADPSLRYVVGNALGGTEAFAMGNNKYFASNYDKFLNRAQTTEGRVAGYEGIYANTQAHVARVNSRKISKEIVATYTRGDKDIVNRRYDNSNISAGISDWFNGDRVSDKKGTINVYFQVDGETIAQATANAADLRQDTIYLQNGFVGG